MSVSRRPLSDLITALGLFVLAIWNFWRASIIAQQRVYLEQIGTTLHPGVRLGLALIWALIFLALAAAVWRRRRATRILLPVAVLLYGAYQLLLLAFMPAPAARQGWPLQLLAWTAALGWVVWAGRRSVPEGSSNRHNRPVTSTPSEPPAALSAVQRGEHGKSEN